MNTFIPADILFPKTDSLEKWSVIACDQFTSQPEYWEDVRKTVGDCPSALHMILPEVELEGDYEKRVPQINATMKEYLQKNLFEEYQNAFVYVERTLKNGSVRKGIVGAVDLEQYDYSADAVSNIRATEKTVVERIPPRKKIRENAPVEMPHILLLCDDNEKVLIEPVTEKKEQLPKLYEFDLMADGGHIAGWLMQGDAAEEFCEILEAYAKKVPEKYQDLNGKPMLFAVGDGNHSLATAKACYEALKSSQPDKDFSNHPARYALVELENIHDEAQQFEPIHRIIQINQPMELLKEMQQEICAEDGYPICWYSGTESGTIYLDKKKGELPVGILQPFLDAYLQKKEGKIDYIHGDDVVKKLAKEENAIGFLLPVMEKGQLFRGIIADGVLPRKTFSMGHAEEKRYYLEARKIIEGKA